jgi:hypothetical protein
VPATVNAPVNWKPTRSACKSAADISINGNISAVSLSLDMRISLLTGNRGV